MDELVFVPFVEPNENVLIFIQVNSESVSRITSVEAYLGTSKHLWWSFFQKCLTVFSSLLFSHKASSQMFDRVLNTPQICINVVCSFLNLKKLVSLLYYLYCSDIRNVYKTSNVSIRKYLQCNNEPLGADVLCPIRIYQHYWTTEWSISVKYTLLWWKPKVVYQIKICTHNDWNRVHVINTFRVLYLFWEVAWNCMRLFTFYCETNAHANLFIVRYIVPKNFFLLRFLYVCIAVAGNDRPKYIQKAVFYTSFSYEVLWKGDDIDIQRDSSVSLPKFK